MPNKKEMNKGGALQLLGLLCISGNFFLQKIIGGFFGILLWAVGIGLIIFGAKKYNQAKHQ